MELTPEERQRIYEEEKARLYSNSTISNRPQYLIPVVVAIVLVGLLVAIIGPFQCSSHLSRLFGGGDDPHAVSGYERETLRLAISALGGISRMGEAHSSRDVLAIEREAAGIKSAADECRALKVPYSYTTHHAFLQNALDEAVLGSKDLATHMVTNDQVGLVRDWRHVNLCSDWMEKANRERVLVEKGR